MKYGKCGHLHEDHAKGRTGNDQMANVDCLVAIWEEKPGGCRGKKRFQYYDVPFMICQEYNERVVLQFGMNMAPYWCSRHDAWHVGHKGKKKAILTSISQLSVH
jgi:hypothetical protein